jgi:mRNA interferase YafQ
VYQTAPTSRFKSDVKKYTRKKDREEIKRVLSELMRGEWLPGRKHHRLRGEYVGYWECHVRPNILLIYKLDDVNVKVSLVRIGSHSELF